MAGTSGIARTPLTRDRVLAGAITVADRDGLAALTIRSLATELGVKPMSVYHHVPGKEAILDGIVDAVFAEFELPAAGGDWRTELRARYASARAVLRRHPWAVALLESRVNPGPMTLRQHDAVLGTLYGGRVRRTRGRPRDRDPRRVRLRVCPPGGHAPVRDGGGGGRPGRGDAGGAPLRCVSAPRAVHGRARPSAGLRLRDRVRLWAGPAPRRAGCVAGHGPRVTGLGTSTQLMPGAAARGRD